MRKEILVTVEAPDKDAERVVPAVEHALDDAMSYPYDVDVAEWSVTVASAPESPLARLRYAACDDYENDVLDQLMLRAGLIWECAARQEDGHACGCRNPEADAACEECGAPRP